MRTPCGAHSTAAVRLALATPARAALLCTIPGIPRVAEAVTLTIAPPRPAAIQRRAAACIISQVPVRLLSTTARQPFGLMSIAALANWPPALLTTTSSAPNRSSAASNSASTLGASRISTALAISGHPRSAKAASTGANRSAERPQVTTAAPSRANIQAAALPIPLPPPETSTTRPANRPSAKVSGASSRRSSATG